MCGAFFEQKYLTLVLEAVYEISGKYYGTENLLLLEAVYEISGKYYGTENLLLLPMCEAGYLYFNKHFAVLSPLVSPAVAVCG